MLFGADIFFHCKNFFRLFSIFLAFGPDMVAFLQFFLAQGKQFAGEQIRPQNRVDRIATREYLEAEFNQLQMFRAKPLDREV